MEFTTKIKCSSCGTIWAVTLDPNEQMTNWTCPKCRAEFEEADSIEPDPTPDPVP